MRLLSKSRYFVGRLVAAFGSPLTRAFSGSSVGNEGEGLMLKRVLVNTVTLLITVGISARYG